MVNPYIALLFFMLLIAGFVLFLIWLSVVCGPKHNTPTKMLPFECGAVSVGNVREHRFNVRFYLVAMLFILFDVEVIFMYPWAVTLKQLGLPAFYAMLSFMFILAIGLLYVWRRGVLNWND